MCMALYTAMPPHPGWHASHPFWGFLHSHLDNNLPITSDISFQVLPGITGVVRGAVVRSGVVVTVVGYITVEGFAGVAVLLETVVLAFCSTCASAVRVIEHTCR